MAASPRMYIEIGSDVKGALKGIDAVRRAGQQMQRDFSALRNIAIGVTGFVAVKRAVSGLADLAKGAAEEQAQQARLARAIANTGKAVDTGLTPSLEDWIGVQERATGFAGNDLREALTQLVLETGDLTEAQDRLSIAWDASSATGRNLVVMAQLLGKVDEDSISQLTRLGLIRGDYTAKTVGGFDKIAAAQEVARKGLMTFDQAMQIVEGGAKGESVMRRLGVPTKDMFADATKGAIDVKGALNELRGNVKGSNAAVAATPLGEWQRLGNEMDSIKKDIGRAVLPMFVSLGRFGLRAINGLRNAFSKFTAGLSGPKLGSARKLWKSVFGVEMPAALGAVVDGFTKIADRIKVFVDDLNSEDPETVRGALRSLAKDLPELVGGALAGIGTELDKLGVLGSAAKLALLGLASSPVTSGLLSTAVGVTDIGRNLLLMGLAVGTAGGAFTVATALMAVASWQVGETVGLVVDRWEDLRKAAHDGSLEQKGLLGELLTGAVLWGDAFSKLGTLVRAALDGIGPAFSRLGTKANEIFGPGGEIGKAFDALGTTVHNHFDPQGLIFPTIGNMFDNAGRKAQEVFGAGGAIGQAFSGLGATISSALGLINVSAGPLHLSGTGGFTVDPPTIQPPGFAQAFSDAIRAIELDFGWIKLSGASGISFNLPTPRITFEMALPTFDVGAWLQSHLPGGTPYVPPPPVVAPPSLTGGPGRSGFPGEQLPNVGDMNAAGAIWTGSAWVGGAGGGYPGDTTGLFHGLSAVSDVLRRIVTIDFGDRRGQQATQEFLTGAGAPATYRGVPNLDHIISQLPDLPRMAAGGIATQPTLAMIGEKGPEAVLPLGRAGSMGFGGDRGVVFARGSIVINGDVDSEDRVKDLGRQFWRQARALGLATS